MLKREYNAPRRCRTIIGKCAALAGAKASERVSRSETGLAGLESCHIAIVIPAMQWKAQIANHCLSLSLSFCSLLYTRMHELSLCERIFTCRCPPPILPATAFSVRTSCGLYIAHTLAGDKIQNNFVNKIKKKKQNRIL